MYLDVLKWRCPYERREAGRGAARFWRRQFCFLRKDMGRQADRLLHAVTTMNNMLSHCNKKVNMIFSKLLYNSKCYFYVIFLFNLSHC